MPMVVSLFCGICFFFSRHMGIFDAHEEIFLVSRHFTKWLLSIDATVCILEVIMWVNLYWELQAYIDNKE